MPNNKIKFPAVSGEAEIKLRRFLTTVCEFMNCEIDLHEVTLIEAEVPPGRGDVILVLSKVAANETKKAKNGSAK